MCIQNQDQGQRYGYTLNMKGFLLTLLDLKKLNTSLRAILY